MNIKELAKDCGVLHGQGYTFKSFTVPPKDLGDIAAYIQEHRRPTKALWRAVIENNLRLAVLTANLIQRENLPAYVAYLHDNAPAEAWGSKDAFRIWISKTGTHDVTDPRD